MAQCPFEHRQDSHIVHGISSPFFMESSGTGKTHMAIGLVNELIEAREERDLQLYRRYDLLIKVL